MPSGNTHDRITLWGLPLITGVTFWQTQSGNLTLLVAGGYLFGGLMFGPDLDIYSKQFQRWGFLRWIWLPYQKSLRHRSFLSHGPIIGTTLRIIYFGCAIAILGVVFLAIVEKLWNVTLNWYGLGEGVNQTVVRYGVEFLVLFLGLELGAMSHYVSDWSGSTYKRFKKKGIAGLLNSGKMKKRKVRRKNRRVKPKTTKAVRPRKPPNKNL